MSTMYFKIITYLSTSWPCSSYIGRPASKFLKLESFWETYLLINIFLLFGFLPPSFPTFTFLPFTLTYLNFTPLSGEHMTFRDDLLRDLRIGSSIDCSLQGPAPPYIIILIIKNELIKFLKKKKIPSGSYVPPAPTSAPPLLPSPPSMSSIVSLCFVFFVIEHLL